MPCREMLPAVVREPQLSTARPDAGKQMQGDEDSGIQACRNPALHHLAARLREDCVLFMWRRGSRAGEAV